MTTPFWLRSKATEVADINTDIVIVGGGYVGLSVAYWLTELKPNLKITVVDRNSCGSGASGRNAGFLTKGSASFYKGLVEDWGVSDALEIYKFAEESLKLVHDHFLRENPRKDFEKTSSMTLFQKQKQLDVWKTNDFSPEAFGFNFQKELPENLKTMFFGGFENGPEYKVNPILLLELIRNKLESRKVKIIESNAAFRLSPEGVETELSTIKAKQVVLALNGYFPEFHPVFNGMITPRRAQMLAVELEGEINCPHLYYDPPERVYWRKTESNVLVIGGKRLLDEKGEVGDFEKISAPIQDGLEQYLKEQLSVKYKVINRWSGTMGFTDHELPLSGKIEAPLETYMIGGFSGHGMGLGFNSARDLAEVIISKKKESFFNKFKKVDFKI